MSGFPYPVACGTFVANSSRNSVDHVDLDPMRIGAPRAFNPAHDFIWVVNGDMDACDVEIGAPWNSSIDALVVYFHDVSTGDVVTRNVPVRINWLIVYGTR